jgi:hypothetical protein
LINANRLIHLAHAAKSSSGSPCPNPLFTYPPFFWRFQIRGSFPRGHKSNDIRLRYITYAPGITSASSPVMILRSTEATL